MTNGLLAITGGGKIYSTLNANKPNAVTINSGGVVAFDNWAWTGSFGKLWFASANINVNGGTLRYVGATGTADGRSLTIGALGATLESATAGQTWQIAVTDTSSLGSSAGGLLTLTGVGIGKIDQIIPGTGGLTKTGNGTWTLSGTNTYSGATTVSAGVLDVRVASSLSSNSLIQIDYDIATLRLENADNGNSVWNLAALKNLKKVPGGLPLKAGAAGPETDLRFFANGAYTDVVARKPGGTLISFF